MKINDIKAIDGVQILEFPIFGDSRGKFSRLFCQTEFNKASMVEPIVQINHSSSAQKGTIRGLHFQNPPHSETKWVRVLKGKIFDVIVDLRKNSDTFLKWTSVELDEKAGRMVCIPKGCAHGFQTLTDNVEMIYFHSEFYYPDFGSGIRYDDPALNIDWPIPPSVISEKDQSLKALDNGFIGLEL